jgi:hypothetical protein
VLDLVAVRIPAALEFRNVLDLQVHGYLPLESAYFIAYKEEAELHKRASTRIEGMMAGRMPVQAYSTSGFEHELDR